MVELFWLGILLLLYTYFIYPILLYVVGRRIDSEVSEPSFWPAVDVLLSAYNEEICIKERIENLLSSNYQGKLRILVANDGSSDKTGEIIDSFQDERVVAYNFSENRGKVAVLNELVSKANAGIIVFTDANTEFTNHSITNLITAFSETVGGVCGELHIYEKHKGQNSDGLYWRYEQFLKKKESGLGALLGANGAIYAIRRELYQPLPLDTVVDDFCIMMNVKKQGFDTIYNDQAQAYEEAAPTLSDEYGRRVRIGLGNFRALVANTWALSPFVGMVSWCFWSHKVLRWFAPHLLLAVFFSNLFLLNQDLYRFSMALQVIFYAIAFLGIRAINRGIKVNKISAIISFFVHMNIAIGHGFIKLFSSNEKGAWTRTARTGETK